MVRVIFWDWCIVILLFVTSLARAIIRAIAVIDACYQNAYRDASLFLDALPGSGDAIAVISKWLTEYPIPNTEMISGKCTGCPYESIKNTHNAKRYVVTTLPYVREQSMFSIQEYAHRIVGIAHYYQDIYRDPELVEVFDIAADLERGDTEEGARRTGIDKIAMLVS